MSDIDKIQADLDSHHIEGRAAVAPQMGSFSVPLISHITGPLWTGGCVGGVELPHDFKYVISLYPWEQYKLGPDTTRFEYRLYDGNKVPPWEELGPIVSRALRCLNEGKTLIHCQAGLNRSGLVAALVCIKNPLTHKTVDQHIARLRERRSRLVLCNPVFEAYLRENF
jgi:hypothetical protein